MLRASLLASLLVLPNLASAQQLPGLYINLGAGPNIVGNLMSSNDTTKVTTNVGPVGVVDFGWTFANGLRTEVEGSYRANDLGDLFTRRAGGALVPLVNPSGSLRTYAVMANIVYDIPLHPFGLALQPYVGGGLGYGWLDFNHAGGGGFGTLQLSSSNLYTGPTAVSFGSAGAFAYQAIIGASLPLRIVPGLEATLEYRFFGMTRSDVPVDRIATNQTNTINGTVPSIATHNGFDFRDNAMLIGLRYRFWGY
jgi:OOP family OmpA-OmpF porin